MRFGGHETFAIREGWLHKGLKLLVEDRTKLYDPNVADWLGVGKNMGKSIKYWLLAAGLGRVSSGNGHDVKLEPTELASLVHQRDPYFLHAGTWWALHVELINCRDHAETWWWFFNRFSLTRFDRATCLSSLAAFLEHGPQRVPAHKTLQRDIGCLIASYATVLPAEQTDPEEADDCPFQELRLMTYSKSTGACSLSTGPKSVPPELLGYALSRSLFMGIADPRPSDVTLREAASKDGGPGKAYAMGADALFELALKAERTLNSSEMKVSGLGAERTIRLIQRPPQDWLAAYYDRTMERKHAA
jgi:hypothetical protein